MIVTTTPDIAGYEITETLGIVWGLTVRARHMGVDCMAGCRNLVGGESAGYTRLVEQTRKQALDRLIENAQQRGADAVIKMYFDSANNAQGFQEVLAFGTAVKIQKKGI